MTALVALAVAVGVWLVVVATLALAGKGTAARELAALVPNLAILFGGLVRDARVPRRAKLVLVLAGAWIASPIDPVPEFIPVVGALDDAIVAAFALRHVIRRAGREVVEAHWRGEPATLERILRLARAGG